MEGNQEAPRIHLANTYSHLDQIVLEERFRAVCCVVATLLRAEEPSGKPEPQLS